MRKLRQFWRVAKLIDKSKIEKWLEDRLESTTDNMELVDQTKNEIWYLFKGETIVIKVLLRNIRDGKFDQ